MWQPIIGGTAVDKWVTAQTPENQNAVTSIFIIDKLANIRIADVILTNRAKNFASTGTFSYNYQDSDGANVGAATMPDKRGVLTDIFRDFMHIRLVDESTNQVYFTGRIQSIDSKFEGQRGETIKLKIVDALAELANISLKGVVDSIDFYPAGTHPDSPFPSNYAGHTVTDMVKALFTCAYQKDLLPIYNTKMVSGFDGGLSTIIKTDELVIDTTYSPSTYIANIVNDDSGTDAYNNRFVTNAVALPDIRRLNLKKSQNQGVLGHILRTLQVAPQESQQNNENFGMDYYIDPNISYKAHATFKGKNLDASTEPPPSMFNVFPRGKRVYNTEPATYGLNIVYPAGSRNNIVSVGHKTITGGATTVATKPMSHEFSFTKPKDDLYTSVLLKYNDGREKESVDREVKLYIMYVTNITGQFKYGTMGSSGNTAYVEPMAFNDDFSFSIDGRNPGSTSVEYLDLYTTGGSLLKQNVARIQYQSHTTISGSTNFGYILVSDIDADLLTRAAGTYSLHGVGNGSGSYASTSQCQVNLGSAVAEEGFPRRVWGLEKETTLSRGAITDLHSLRLECAALLSRSTKALVDGSFGFSGPPSYHWDGEIRSVSSVSGGQAITVKNPGGTAFVSLPLFGFREGMMIAKMDSNYIQLAQTGAGKDIYGYCWNVASSSEYHVTLSPTSETFSVGDKVRFFIPIRAGDTIRVVNELAGIESNMLINKVEYSEEPNQMTRVSTTGVNEGVGIQGVKYQALLSGSREESDATMNLPRGHQTAVWTGLFSAVDSNTIQWATVGGSAEVLLSDGTSYSIDTATTNSNHTTDASGTDKDSTRFGLATAPAVGDATVYYIYLDPNKEQPGATSKYHFYTRPSTSPVTGNDPVYVQDGDNVIIGWFKAGATSADNAEFGVYRDSKPSEGKRNAPTLIHPSSLTSTLLSKGSRPWTSNISIRGKSAQYNQVIWDDGESSPGNATLNFSDGTDTVTIVAGEKTSGLADNTTYYMYLNGISGNVTPSFTATHSASIGDSKILIALVVIGDNTKGTAPTILPFNSKVPTLNAVAIAADSITGTHVQADTIATAHITGTITGDHIQVSSGTNFSSNAYDPSRKTKTWPPGTGNAPGGSSPTGPPTSENDGDVWVADDTKAIYVAKGLGVSSIVTSGNGWYLQNNSEALVGEKSTIFNTSSTPTSNAIGDTWIHPTTHLMKVSTQANSSAHWAERDDADAVNNAQTSINGGLIKTQRIQLLKGGSTAPALKTTVSTLVSTGRLLDDSGGINATVTTVGIDAQGSAFTTGRRLTGAMTNNPADTTLDVVTQGGGQAIAVNDIVKVENEEMYVTAVTTSDTRYVVIRGFRGTTIAAHNPSGNPSVYPYLYKYHRLITASDTIRVGSEDMYVESVNTAGTQLTVIRDWNGTDAASHSDNAAISIYDYSIEGMLDPHIIMDYKGITGYSDAFSPEFTIDSNTGKATFADGTAILDCDGITLGATSSGSKAFQIKLNSWTSGDPKYFFMYSSNSADGVYIGADGNTSFPLYSGCDLLPSSSAGLQNLGKSGFPWNQLYAKTLAGDCISDSSANNVSNVAVSREALYNHEQTTHGGGGSADGVVNSASWNTSTGVLTLGRSESLSSITVDLDGRYSTTDTNTTYSAGNGIDLSGTTFSHTDTSSQGSSNSNSGTTFIQNITLDTYGHITNIGTGTAGGSGTVSSGNTGYVAYYTGSTTVDSKTTAGGIQFVDNDNITVWANLNLGNHNLTVRSDEGIKFEDGNSPHNTCTLIAPYYIGTSYTLTLPGDDGSANEVLQTNGSGVLDWVAWHEHSQSYGFNADSIHLENGTSSAGDLAVSFRIDTNTGIYRSSSDQLSIMAGGLTGVMVDEINSNIRVGIGGMYTTGYALKVHGETAKTSGGGYWDDYSDDRIKTDVASISGGMTTIAALNPVSYKFTDAWKEAVSSKQHATQYGFLASEYKAVFPNYSKAEAEDLVKIDGKWELVNHPEVDEDGEIKNNETRVIEEKIEDIMSINEAAIVPHLVAAIKELEARIKVLEGNG